MNNFMDLALTGFLGAVSNRPLDVLQFLEEKRRQRERERLAEEELAMQQRRLQLAEEAAKLSTAESLRQLGVQPGIISKVLQTGKIPVEELRPREMVFGETRPFEEDLTRLMSVLPHVEDITVEKLPATLRGKPYVPTPEAYAYEPTPAEGEFKPPKTVVKAKISPYKTPQETKRAVFAKLREILPREKWEMIATGKVVPTVEDIIAKYKTLREAAKTISQETGVPLYAVEDTLGLPTDPSKKKDDVYTNFYTRLKALFGDKYSDDQLKAIAFQGAYGGRLQIDLENDSTQLSLRTVSKGPYDILTGISYDKKTGKPLGTVIYNVDFNRTWIDQRTNNLAVLGAIGGASPEVVGAAVEADAKVILGTEGVPLGERFKTWSMYVTSARAKNPKAMWAYLYKITPTKIKVGDTFQDSKIGKKLRTQFQNLMLHANYDSFAPEQIPQIAASLQYIVNTATNDYYRVAQKAAKGEGETAQAAREFLRLLEELEGSIITAPSDPDSFINNLNKVVKFLEEDRKLYQKEKEAQQPQRTTKPPTEEKQQPKEEKEEKNLGEPFSLTGVW
mgnify:CR=1 FL=1